MALQARPFDEPDILALLRLLRNAPETTARRRILRSLETARRCQLARGAVRWLELLPSDAEALWADVMTMRHLLAGDERRPLEHMLGLLALMKERDSAARSRTRLEGPGPPTKWRQGCSGDASCFRPVDQSVKVCSRHVTSRRAARGRVGAVAVLPLVGGGPPSASRARRVAKSGTGPNRYPLLRRCPSSRGNSGPDPKRPRRNSSNQRRCAVAVHMHPSLSGRAG